MITARIEQVHGGRDPGAKGLHRAVDQPGGEVIAVL